MGSLIKKVIDYIKENYYLGEIFFSDILEKFFVSFLYLSRLFKKEIGKNFFDFINEYRIEKVKQFLFIIDFKIYEVVDRVGILDLYYFLRFFKCYIGYSFFEYKEGVKLKGEKVSE